MKTNNFKTTTEVKLAVDHGLVDPEVTRFCKLYFRAKHEEISREKRTIKMLEQQREEELGSR